MCFHETRSVALGVLFLIMGTGERLQSADSPGPVGMKRLLLEHFEENGGRNPWKREWELFKKKGDLFPAAAEILRENEKIPEDPWGISMNRQWVFAFNILCDLGLEGDPRVGPLFLPYLKRPFQPALPEHPDIDQRWLETRGYMIRANDPEGCRYLRERLRGTEATTREKHWILEHIYNFGSPQWVPFLKTLQLSPADLASDMRLGISLKATIDELEKRAAEKGAVSPPAGTDSPTGPLNKTTQVAPYEPSPASPKVPHEAPDKSGAFPEPESTSPAWLRPAIAALLVCVLAITGAAFLLRRRQGRR